MLKINNLRVFPLWQNTFINARSAVQSLQNIQVTASTFTSVNKKNLSAFGGVNRKPTILFIGDVSNGHLCSLVFLRSRGNSSSSGFISLL